MRRSFQRASEIGASLPDGTLLVHGLEPAALGLGRLDGQSAFRIASARSQLAVDERPGENNVLAYSQVLLAEAETLQLAAVGGGAGNQNVPKVKALQTSPKTPQAGSKSCKFWGSEGGCRQGRSCSYLHGQLEDQKNRCWICSATGHRKIDCPAKALVPPLPPATGGSEGGIASKGSGKSSNPQPKRNNNKPRGEIKEDGGGGGNAPALRATTSEPAGGQTTVTEPKNEGSGESVTGEGEKKTSTSSTAATTSTGGEAALMSEVAGLLRSLRMQDQGPALRVCQLRRIGSDHAVNVLLDGGATHCLRQSRSQLEWEESKEVNVALAQGEVVLRQHPGTATLLTQERIQPIIPLSKITELGFRVQWDASTCCIEHPSFGKLKIQMEQGCPTVGAEVGQWLMSEVERSQQTKAKMRAVMAGLKSDGTPEQERWKQLRDLFPDVPLRFLQRIPGDSKWKGERLPFNRRVRRKLERASMVVVHAFCGKDDGFWKRLETDKIAVLPLDLCHGADLLDPDLGGFLEELAMKGKINLWLAGPPCRSTSVARHREDSGPKPVRGRDLQDRFGLSNLQPHEQHLVDQDSTLWLKNLWWIWLARQHQLPDGWFQSLVEQPQDPCEWKDPQGEFPSFTIWPETKKVLAAVGMKSTRLEQGALGHSTPKPTVLMSSIPEVASLEGLKSQNPGKVWPSTVNERLKFSSSLAEWAPGLKRLLAEVIQQRGETGPGLKRLTQSDKESIAAWQAHFDMNHIPFRHDCSVCLESAGKDRQRRKLECRSSYCMSVDIAGPFQPGQDQAQGVAPRYFIVANVSIPMTSSGPLVDGLMGSGLQASSTSTQRCARELGW